jgi:hypothetical protein
LTKDIALNPWKTVDAIDSFEDRRVIGILAVDIEELKNASVKSEPKSYDGSSGEGRNNGSCGGRRACIGDERVIDADASSGGVIDSGFGESLLGTNGHGARRLEEVWGGESGS